MESLVKHSSPPNSVSDELKFKEEDELIKIGMVFFGQSRIKEYSLSNMEPSQRRHHKWSLGPLGLNQRKKQHRVSQWVRNSTSTRVIQKHFHENFEQKKSTKSCLISWAKHRLVHTQAYIAQHTIHAHSLTLTHARTLYRRWMGCTTISWSSSS